MTPELERAVKRYRQWFGTYKKSGELVKIQVWLTVNNGSIEFLTLAERLSAYEGIRAFPRRSRQHATWRERAVCGTSPAAASVPA
jgi:hypothetical protein